MVSVHSTRDAAQTVEQSLIAVSDVPREVSGAPLDHASGQGTAGSAQLAVPWGAPCSGVEQAAEKQ